MVKKNKNSFPKWGDIWLAYLGDSKENCIQSGYRPVLIISNNMNNEYSPNVNIIPMTTRTKKRSPVHVKLKDCKRYGIKKPSTLLLEQLMTIPVDSLDICVGEIRDQETIEAITKAMLTQFSIFPSFNVNLEQINTINRRCS